MAVRGPMLGCWGSASGQGLGSWRRLWVAARGGGQGHRHAARAVPGAAGERERPKGVAETCCCGRELTACAVHAVRATAGGVAAVLAGTYHGTSPTCMASARSEFPVTNTFAPAQYARTPRMTALDPRPPNPSNHTPLTPQP